MAKQRKIKVVFILYQVGPYHFARFEALHKKIDLNVIPLSRYSHLREWYVKDFNKYAPLFDDVVGQTQKNVVDSLIEKLEIISPEVVIISGYFYPAMRAAARWAKRNGRKTILISESNYFDKKRFFLIEKLKGWWLRHNFDACFVGGIRAKQYCEKLGFSANQIWTGYNVVDNNYFYSRKNYIYESNSNFDLSKKYFLYVGRFAPEKNLHRLLFSYKKLSREIGTGKWGLVMVGAGPIEKELQELCKREVIPNVTWTGFQQIDSLSRLYYRASILILPSVREPWGLVVNEAMACGLPILLSSRCGSALDLVIHGRNGWIFDPFSIEDIFLTMKRVVQNEGLLAEMGEQSLEIIKNYSVENFASSLSDSVQSLV